LKLFQNPIPGKRSFGSAVNYSAMHTILITGATGNVGVEVIRALLDRNREVKVFAGVRDAATLTGFEAAGVENRVFDFNEETSQVAALQNVDAVFLLLPPNLPDAPKRFAAIIEVAKKANVKHVVFHSVQGAEKNKRIPHYKIEQLVQKSGLPYTFLRPAYFMQNFTTILRNDLVQKKRIYLPAGKAAFTLIDVADIGKVAAAVLSDYGQHRNKAYALTTAERYTFSEMAAQLSAHLGMPVKYVSPNLMQFFQTKRSEGLPTGFILVMIMLHYLPRFQKPPEITNCVQEVTGAPPTTFRQFIERNKHLLTG
jgi:uncharacterized protein YbjT (DUF2867 family)